MILLSRVGASPLGLRLDRFCFHRRPLQGCFSYHTFCVPTMDGPKKGPHSIYIQKKKKLVIPVWRPLSTQSGSGITATLGSSSADYDNHSKGLKEKQSTFSCEVENFSERHEHTSISGANRRVEVVEQSGHGYRSTEVAGLASDVEKHSVTVEDAGMGFRRQSGAILYERLSDCWNFSCAQKDNFVHIPLQISTYHRNFMSLITRINNKRILQILIDGNICHDELKVEYKAHNPESVVWYREVDASLIRFIKGKGGSTQKQIEGETGVKILFPSSNKDDFIVIEGNSDESVTKASKKIAKVLEEVVKSPSLDYSHFISLPLAIHLDLVDKLQNFQNAILGCSASGQDSNLDGDSDEDTPDDNNNEGKPIAVTLEVINKRKDVKVKSDTADTSSNAGKLPSSVLSELGIDKSIFIKPKTFHLTVLMLKLWNKDRVAAATEVLQKISSQVNDALDNRPVFIALKGLECMRGSPAKARVVYAPVEEIGGEGRLLRACQVIVKAYVEAGLVLEKDARQTLKLHATLMNARHRKGKETRRHDSFDARGIFLRYGSKKWGDYLIREAHLSQRFVFDESGYYHCCASIPFPEGMQVE